MFKAGFDGAAQASGCCLGVTYQLVSLVDQCNEGRHQHTGQRDADRYQQELETQTWFEKGEGRVAFH